MVNSRRVRAQKHHASALILLCDLHTHYVPVEGNHFLSVADVNANVSESYYSRHYIFLVACLRVAWDLSIRV
jgi:hypothetical protein